MKEKFLELMKSVDRENIDKLLDWLDYTDFYTAPASTKYHGNYECGLLKHSMKVYNLFKFKCKCYKEKTDMFIPDESSQKIMALFHDVCKINFYKIGNRNVKNEKTNQWEQKKIYEIDDNYPVTGHGTKSVIILQQFIKLEDYEIFAICNHMGVPVNYGDMKAYDFSLKKYPFTVLLHTADEESSAILEKTI